jgi:hypothetical protein
MAKTYGKLDYMDSKKTNEKKTKNTTTPEAELLKEKYNIVKKCFGVLNSAPDAAIIILAYNIDDDGTKRITLRDGSETFLCSTEVLRVDSVEELTETIKELSDNDECIALKIYGEAFSGFADELSMFYNDAIIKDAQNGCGFANIPKEHIADFVFEYDEKDNHLIGLHHIDEEVSFEDDEDEEEAADYADESDFDDGDFKDNNTEEYTEEEEASDFAEIAARLKSIDKNELTEEEAKNIEQVIGAMEILQKNISYWRSLIGENW